MLSTKILTRTPQIKQKNSNIRNYLTCSGSTSKITLNNSNLGIKSTCSSPETISLSKKNFKYNYLMGSHQSNHTGEVQKLTRPGTYDNNVPSPMILGLPVQNVPLATHLGFNGNLRNQVRTVHYSTQSGTYTKNVPDSTNFENSVVTLPKPTKPDIFSSNVPEARGKVLGSKKLMLKRHHFCQYGSKSPKMTKIDQNSMQMTENC